MKRKVFKHRNVNTRIKKIENLHQTSIDEGYITDRSARSLMIPTIKRLKSVYHRLQPKMNIYDFDTLADYVDVHMIDDVSDGIQRVSSIRDMSAELSTSLHSIKKMFWIYDERDRMAVRRNTRAIKQLLKEVVIKINQEVTKWVSLEELKNKIGGIKEWKEY